MYRCSSARSRSEAGNRERRAASCLIVLVLLSFWGVAIGAQEGARLRRGLVICIDRKGLTFFRRGECPPRFFETRRPGYMSRPGGSPNFCKTTNLKPNFGRIRFPSESLCWDR